MSNDQTSHSVNLTAAAAYNALAALQRAERDAGTSAEAREVRSFRTLLKAHLIGRRDHYAPIELKGSLDYFRQFCRLCRNVDLTFDVALQLERTI